ncbi:hypothetical protein ACU8MT_01320 [Rhizobium leguminosarum]
MTTNFDTPQLPPAFLQKSDRIWLAETPYFLRLRTGWIYILTEQDGDGTSLFMPHPVLAAGLARIEYRS